MRLQEELSWLYSVHFDLTAQMQQFLQSPDRETIAKLLADNAVISDQNERLRLELKAALDELDQAHLGFRNHSALKEQGFPFKIESAEPSFLCRD